MYIFNQNNVIKKRLYAALFAAVLIVVAAVPSKAQMLSKSVYYYGNYNVTKGGGGAKAAIYYQIGNTPSSCNYTAHASSAIFVGASDPYNETIYLASDLGNASGYITSISYYFDKRNAMSSSHNMTIYLKQTTLNKFSSGNYTASASTMTKVYEENITSWTADGAG